MENAVQVYTLQVIEYTALLGHLITLSDTYRGSGPLSGDVHESEIEVQLHNMRLHNVIVTKRESSICIVIVQRWCHIT
jgi:hypothetical protein